LNLLEIINLTKLYPSSSGNSANPDIIAVDNISLAIKKGLCFGLLGPNGAGKTTMIEICEGIVAPTAGEIFYKGGIRKKNFYEEIGIQFQSTSLFALLTVREILEVFRSLYKKPASSKEIIETCHLEDILNRQNNKISGGQKQRLMLALALVNNPELIFLDEPTTGLDPQARRYLWDTVEKIKSRGKTIILTTHYMDEAQILCDEIAIIDKGKIIAQGKPNELLKKYCSGVTVNLPIKKENSSEKLRILKSFAQKNKINFKLIESQDLYEFFVKNLEEFLKFIIKNKIDFSQISIRPQNLEDLFIKLTGRKLRD